MHDPDPEERRAPGVSFAGRRMPLPPYRWQRVLIGALLVIGGVFGFLPVLGLWMLPLGLLVLSVDLPIARRWRRQVEVWWGRRRQRKQAEREARDEAAAREERTFK